MKQDKNPPFMAHQSEADQIIPSQPLEPKDHHANMEQQQEKEEEEEEEHNSIDAREKYKDSSKVTSQDPCASKITEKEIGVAALEGEDSGREKLKRHRIEVAKRVWIPEIWEQEELLMDWIDCTAFDASLVPSTITTARAALVEQDRRRTTNATAASAGLRIENSSLHQRRFGMFAFGREG